MKSHVDSLLIKAGLPDRYCTSSYLDRDTVAALPLESLLSIIYALKKETSDFLQRYGEKNNSTDVADIESALCFSESTEFENRTYALSQTLSKIQHESKKALSKNSISSQKLISDIMGEAKKLEMEIKSLKEMLFFLSSYKQLEVAGCADWKSVFYYLQEIAPLLQVIETFKVNYELAEKPLVERIQSSLENYHRCKALTLAHIKELLSTLFTFQGYLRTNLTREKPNPFSTAQEKNPFASPATNPFLMADEGPGASSSPIPASELLYLAACIGDLLGERTLILDLYLIIQFKEYFKIFPQDQEISAVSQLSERLDWLTRRVQIIRSDHSSFIPKEWNIECEFIKKGIAILSTWMLRSLSKKPVESILELCLSLKQRILSFDEEACKLVGIELPSQLSESLEPYLSLLLHDHKKYSLLSIGVGSSFESPRAARTNHTPLTFFP